ncbi:MAG: hypothetical protein ACRDNZ_21975 [Streptosporangiaceae bacterium]
MGYVQLAEPVRFRHDWEREATLRLRAGDASVLAVYDEQGRLRGGDAGRRWTWRAAAGSPTTSRGRTRCCWPGPRGRPASCPAGSATTSSTTAPSTPALRPGCGTAPSPAPVTWSWHAATTGPSPPGSTAGGSPTATSSEWRAAAAGGSSSAAWPAATRVPGSRPGHRVLTCPGCLCCRTATGVTPRPCTRRRAGRWPPRTCSWTGRAAGRACTSACRGAGKPTTPTASPAPGQPTRRPGLLPRRNWAVPAGSPSSESACRRARSPPSRGQGMCPGTRCPSWPAPWTATAASCPLPRRCGAGSPTPTIWGCWDRSGRTWPAAGRPDGWWDVV